MTERAKYDPLEAAKVTDKVRATDDASLAREDWTPPSKAAQKPRRATVIESVAVPVVETTPSAPPRVWRLTCDRVMSISGYTGRFKAGTIFDPAGHGGEAGIQRLIAAGVPLEAVED